jgi:uncharacterized protein (DUF58 family)
MIWRRLPILPTRNFAALLFVLGSMWYAASNQNNAPAYLMLFALTGAFLVSIPHTLLNLRGLNTRAESIKPTFAGQEVSVPIEIRNQSRTARRGLAVGFIEPAIESQRVDEIGGQKATRVVLRFPALTRGEHEIDSVCLTTAYPLGFLKAQRCLKAPQSYLVYPKPAGNPRLPEEHSPGKPGTTQPATGGDDFAGLNRYIPGESQRRIDWKAVARGQPMMTKQFATETTGPLYLDFAATGSPTVEDRLSQLSLWVIEAERARRPYGLRLPGAEISPSLGESHFHRCLRMLALFK